MTNRIPFYQRRAIGPRYDPAWFNTEFSNIQRTAPGLFLPPWIGAPVTSASTKMAERLSLRSFGAGSTDGVADDTDKINLAVEAAVSANQGAIYCNPGFFYRIRDTIELPSGVTLYSDVFPAGGTEAFANLSPTFLHDFVGDLFWFSGRNGITAGTGGGLEKIRIVQVHGTPASTGGVGNAVKVTQVGANQRPNWTRISYVNIEEVFGTYAPWTWALNADGQGTQFPELYIDRLDTHVSASDPDTGTVRLDGGAILYSMANCGFSQNGTISIGPTSQCNGPTIVNCTTGSPLVLDHCANAMVIGGIFSDITNTANTTGNCFLMPGRLLNAFTDLSGGACALFTYDSTLKAWISSRPINVQGGGSFRSGSGAPSNADGANGDFYFRSDNATTATQMIYKKAAGAWVGVV